MLTVNHDPTLPCRIAELAINESLYYLYVNEAEIAVLEHVEPNNLTQPCKLPCEDATMLPRPFGEIRHMTDEQLSTYFWDDINPRLDDPFINFERQPDGLRLGRGSESEFHQAFAALAQTFQTGCLNVRVDEESVCFDPQYPPAPDFQRVADALIEYFSPSGLFYEYNDEAADKVSGYEGFDLLYEYEPEDSARECLAARIVLRRFLAEIGKSHLIDDLAGTAIGAISA